MSASLRAQPAEHRPARPTPSARPASPLLPLGALAAGFGLMSWAGPAEAQGLPPAEPAASAVAPTATASAPIEAASTPVPSASAAESAASGPEAAPVAAPAAVDAVLPKLTVKGQATGKASVQATTTSIGKGRQALRDVPQSVTVVTEKLLDDRNLDTLKEALKNTAGISFQAAEGGEEDIRLRGFSLQSTGDIFIDGMRDPAFYDRDSFNWDRLEVLRGSASMLFGRGSTGGAVNQVSKQPLLIDRHEVALTLGTENFRRVTGDFNLKTGEEAALRINVMSNKADEGYGGGLSKHGIAPTYRFGIGTADEFSVGLYHLKNRNGVNYGLAWLGGGLWPTDPNNYYGAASDTNRTSTTQGSFSHIHRFAPEQELKTQVRLATYDRDLRASAIRFADTDPNTAGNQPPTVDSFGDATVLTRGTNNKKMDMDTRYVQSDYSGKHEAWNLKHQVAAGVDAGIEKFRNFGFSLPTGVTLTKPTTTVGTPSDGGGVDESQRIATENRNFKSKALGIYAQDLVEIAPKWKLLGGLRWDKFSGDYTNLAPVTGNAATNPCTVAQNASVSRSDSLWSKRFGVLYQPTERQSYHASYGTSFNTSGDTYQYDAGTAQTDPESSRNIEVGAKIDSADGRFSTRVAVFESTKYNERNRDSESVNACNYVLSGQRHASGLELDLAGRITPEWEVFGSYAYIPNAKVDASSGAAGTEAVGSRPGLTPRHSGTVWTTYKFTPRLRFGGGLNARGGVQPVGLAAGSANYAPRYVTADLMGEYTIDALSLKLNVNNVTDKHYADYVYRGHYVPGRGRGVQLTAAYTF